MKDIVNFSLVVIFFVFITSASAQQHQLMKKIHVDQSGHVQVVDTFDNGEISESRSTEAFEKMKRISQSTPLDHAVTFSQPFQSNMFNHYPSESMNPGPDLKWFTSVLGGTANHFTWKVTIINIGTTQAGACHLAWYLMKEPKFQAGDILLAVESVPPLMADSSSKVTMVVNVSGYPGDWYTGFVIDYLNEVAEDNENNNTFIMGDIHIRAPDIVVTQIHVIDGEGPDLVYKLTVKNQGRITTNNDFKNRIYLSADNIITDSDYLINDWNVNEPLANGEFKTSWDLTSTVSGVPAGEYYLGAVADAKNDIVEENETNNTKYVDSPKINMPDQGADLWSVQQTGIENQLWYVSAVSHLNAWIAGLDNVVLRTMDGGQTWINVWQDSESANFVSIDALDENTAFVSGWTGDYGQGENIGVIFKTTDGGDSWMKVHQHEHAWVNHVKMLDQIQGIGIGDPVENVWKIVRTTDEGNSWQQIAEAPASNQALWSGPSSVFWLNAYKGWFGTNSSDYYYTVDRGMQWFKASIPDLTQTNTISFNAIGVGMAGSHEGKLACVMENGDHWETITAPNEGAIRYLRYDQNAFWLLLENAIYNTHDHGLTWFIQTTADYPIRHLTFTSDHQGTSGWAVCDHGVVLKYFNPKAMKNLLVNGDFSNQKTGWILVLISSAQASGSVQDGEYVMAIDNAGDQTWDINLKQIHVLIENGKTYFVSFDAYADAPRQILAFAGKNTDPWTLYGSRVFDMNTSRQTYTFSFTMTYPTDPEARFAFDLGLSIHRVHLDNIILYGVGEATDVEDNHPISQVKPESFSLFHNSPNPFNSTTTIRFNLPESSFVTLKVFDILGREITTLLNERKSAGRYQVIWNCRNFPSGIYLCRLTAGGFTETSKLILQK